MNFIMFNLYLHIYILNIYVSSISNCLLWEIPLAILATPSKGSLQKKTFKGDEEVAKANVLRERLKKLEILGQDTLWQTNRSPSKWWIFHGYDSLPEKQPSLKQQKNKFVPAFFFQKERFIWTNHWFSVANLLLVSGRVYHENPTYLPKLLPPEIKV